MERRCNNWDYKHWDDKSRTTSYTPNETKTRKNWSNSWTIMNETVSL